MTTWTPDPSFYPSPRMAMKAAPETLAYVASFDPDRKTPDAIAVIDVDPASANFNKIVETVSLPPDLVAHHIFYNRDASKAYLTALGKSELETFFRITLPLASRGVFAGVVLSFARALGEFGATLMLAGNIPGKTQTMPLAIYEAVIAGADRQAQILALVLTAVSVTAIYLTNKLTGGRTQGM